MNKFIKHFAAFILTFTVLMTSAVYISPAVYAEDLSQTLESDDIKALYDGTAEYIFSLGTAVLGSVAGEWAVIGLARSSRAVPDGYYDNVLEYVDGYINEKEQLHRVKSTDNSRVILALTALGYDVSDVGGHDLLMGLADLEYVKAQGINGPIWALIALDSHGYEIPESADAAEPVTRDALIEYILNLQLSDGGWALSGKNADPDMTAMALQSLAPYYGKNDTVRTACEKALTALSEIQKESGGFASWGSVNSESCAQVLVALTALGIDPDSDARFIKNGNSVVNALCSFSADGTGFKHIADGKLNGMATEQGYYALAAYFRYAESKTSLYNMSDVTLKKDEADTPDTGSADETEPPADTEQSGEPVASDKDVSDTGENTEKNDAISSDTEETVKEDTVSAEEGGEKVVIPETGDNSLIIVYAVIMLLAVTALITKKTCQKFARK